MNNLAPPRQHTSSSRSNGSIFTKSDHLPKLDISKGDASKLDEMTLFTHQFLKYGEQKNIIRNADKRLHQTIQKAKVIDNRRNSALEQQSTLNNNLGIENSSYLKISNKQTNRSSSTQMPSARVKKNISTNKILDFEQNKVIKNAFKAYSGEEKPPDLPSRKAIVPYLSRVKPPKDAYQIAPLMKRTIKQGKFSRIYMKQNPLNTTTPSVNQQSPKFQNINEDIFMRKSHHARRASDIPVKQTTLDEYMKKYDNEPQFPEEKYNMSVPPSNKTLQMMNNQHGTFVTKGIMLNQQSFADSDFNKKSGEIKRSPRNSNSQKNQNFVFQAKKDNLDSLKEDKPLNSGTLRNQDSLTNIEIELINMQKQKLRIQQQLNNLDLQMIDQKLNEINMNLPTSERDHSLPKIKKKVSPRFNMQQLSKVNEPIVVPKKKRNDLPQKTYAMVKKSKNLNSKLPNSGIESTFESNEALPKTKKIKQAKQEKQEKFYPIPIVPGQSKIQANTNILSQTRNKPILAKTQPGSNTFEVGEYKIETPQNPKNKQKNKTQNNFFNSKTEMQNFYQKRTISQLTTGIMPIPSNLSGTLEPKKKSPKPVPKPVTQLEPIKIVKKEKARLQANHDVFEIQANTSKLVPLHAELPKSPTKMRMDLLSKEQILPESTIHHLNTLKQEKSFSGQNKKFHKLMQFDKYVDREFDQMDQRIQHLDKINNNPHKNVSFNDGFKHKKITSRRSSMKDISEIPKKAVKFDVYKPDKESNNITSRMTGEYQVSGVTSRTAEREYLPPGTIEEAIKRTITESTLQENFEINNEISQFRQSQLGSQGRQSAMEVSIAPESQLKLAKLDMELHGSRYDIDEQEQPIQTKLLNNYEMRQMVNQLRHDHDYQSSQKDLKIKYQKQQSQPKLNSSQSPGDRKAVYVNIQSGEDIKQFDYQ